MNTQNKNVNLINETSRKISDDLFQRVFEIVQRNENIESKKCLNLRLTEDITIKELNKKFLGKDEFTDVIAFPFSSQEIPFLGDIIIDINIACEQRGKNSLQRELEILFLHGLLHLLGYDHLSRSDARIMRSKEKKYLKILRGEK